MKERPIVFSGAMVRALLAGTKTQTRGAIAIPDGGPWWPYQGDDGENALCYDGNEHSMTCPYGLPGDCLWVREAWAEVGGMDPGLIVYRADYPACVPAGYENVPPASAITWKPSIHMFRKHSRILLEITEVRVERLQDIREADCIAEGIEPNWSGDLKTGRNGFGGEGWEPDCGWRHYINSVDDEPAYTPVESYRSLWDHLGGSWASNPWVWAVSFRIVSPNTAPNGAKE